VTLFIRKGGQYAAIRKPSYPKGLFRAPSSGVEPGESVEAGALREALEETGLEIRLSRYVFRSRVRFTHRREESVDWTSHVFTADWIKGEIAPIDTVEIAEAIWVTRTELEASVPLLRAAPSGGLR
jgi:8-oxo-dGTP pyrophosphatase MutT (NUDIX family)